LAAKPADVTEATTARPAAPSPVAVEVGCMAPERPFRAIVVSTAGSFQQALGGRLEAAGIMVVPAAGPDLFERLEPPPAVILLGPDAAGGRREEWCRRLKADARTAAIPHVHVDAPGAGGVSGRREATLEEGCERLELDAAGFVAVVRTAARLGVLRRRAREFERRVREFGDRASDVFYRIRLWPDRRFEFVSRAVETITGYTAQEYYADPDLGFRIVHPDDRPVLESIARGDVRVEAAHTLRWRRKDGALVWIEQCDVPVIDETGRVVAIEGVAREVSSRVKAELALRESEQKFRLLADSTSTAIFIYQGSKFRYVNPACERLSGYTAAELLAMDFWEIVHPDFRELVRARGFARQAGESVPNRYEFQIVTKAGEARWVDFTATLIEYEGQPAGLGTAYDITDAKEAAAREARIAAELRQVQKMEAIGRLAGGVAHDFNNMLSVILGYVEVAQSRLAPEDPLSEDLREIRQAAERSAELTRQLLAFSRRQLSKPRTLDLNAFLREQAGLLARLMGEDIELQLVLDEHLGNVRIDPAQLTQVLTNLAANARDAIQGSGRVLIETANVELDDQYRERRPYVQAGPYVMLAVTDTGVGMDAGTIENIFEPFFTTKRGGTGLGLATVYGIVKQHGGFIHVYSEPGHGATFKVYLPRAYGQAEPPVDRPRTPLEARGETVLIVEDEPAVLNLARAILERHGYRVLAARTPGEACLLVEQYADPIHLLVTDVIMPAMNGRELEERLRRMQPGLRTLFMSGYTANVIAQRGTLKPGVEFLQKPFSAQALAEAVRRVLDRPLAS